MLLSTGSPAAGRGFEHLPATDIHLPVLFVRPPRLQLCVLPVTSASASSIPVEKSHQNAKTRKRIQSQSISSQGHATGRLTSKKALLLRNKQEVPGWVELGTVDVEGCCRKLLRKPFCQSAAL
jgi:hypothetical protein